MGRRSWTMADDEKIDSDLVSSSASRMRASLFRSPFIGTRIVKV